MYACMDGCICNCIRIDRGIDRCSYYAYLCVCEQSILMFLVGRLKYGSLCKRDARVYVCGFGIRADDSRFTGLKHGKGLCHDDDSAPSGPATS